jgi:carboxyl-terminal processing protease
MKKAKYKKNNNNTSSNKNTKKYNKNNNKQSVSKKKTEKDLEKTGVLKLFNKEEKDSPAVKAYKKKKQKKEKKKFNGKFNLDILDILIIVVIVAILSCLFTGLILNYQYKRNNINNLVKDENVKKFLNTYSEIVDNYYEEIDEAALMDSAIEGMLNHLKDNYSIYLDADQTDLFNEVLDGSYQGIGIVAVGNIVINVYPNSPAEEAGLKANDVIIRVNGTTITNSNFEIVSDLIKKDQDNDVVIKRGDEELSFKIKASTIDIPSVTSSSIDSKNDENNIGYIALSSFSAKTGTEFKEHLEKLEKEKKIKSLIIDLRGNSGGYLNIAYEIAQIFLSKGEMVYSLQQKGNIKEYKDETDENRSYKIVILVNGTTASSAEVLTAALHDSYGATIVGKTTYGKGKVQTIKYLEGTMVKYTSAVWLRPTGECIDGVGIKPDHDVDVLYEKNTIMDKQYDRAIELLS